MKSLAACLALLCTLACGSVTPPTSAPASPPLALDRLPKPGGPPTPSPLTPSYMPTEAIDPVKPPFAMPQPTRPNIPAGVFDIRDFGAVADGKTKATAAFRQAIAKAGGKTSFGRPLPSEPVKS